MTTTNHGHIVRASLNLLKEIMGPTNRGYIVRASLELLEEIGPMTAADIALHLGVSRYLVHAAMSRMRDPDVKGGKRVYVQRWTHTADKGRAYPRPVYAIGSKPDAPKPKRDVLSVRRKSAARVLTLRRNSSVFRLGMTRDEIRQIGKAGA